MQLLFASYGLNAEKVIGAVTDNAKNFEKAFREFGLASEEFDYSAAPKPITIDNQEIDFFSEVVDATTLSNRFKCGSHTFNLIGTKDITSAQTDKIYSRLYVASFAKLNRLWNKTQYPKSSETIRDILGSGLNRPVPTRWNSVPENVSSIMSKDAEKLDDDV